MNRIDQAVEELDALGGKERLKSRCKPLLHCVVPRFLALALILSVLILGSTACTTRARWILYPAAGLPLDLIDVPFKTLDYVPALGNVTTTVYEIVAGEATMLLTFPYWVWSPWHVDWVGNPMFLTSFFWTEKSDRVTNAVLMGEDSVYRFWGVGIDVVREELREGIKNLMPGEDIFEWAENIDERLAALVDRAEELESEGGRYIYGGSRIGDNERVSWEYFPFFRKMFPQTTAAE